MKRIFILLLIMALSRAEATINDPSTMSMDELFYHANRAASTDARASTRAVASEELRRRGVETLTFYLDHTHIENIMYFVKINELMPRPGYDGLPADEVIPVFRNALTSEHKKTRRAALYYLRRYDRPDGELNWLLPHLEKDSDIDLAIRLLGHWGEVEQRERIEGFLESDQERRRVSAVIALGDLQQKESIPELLKMLKDEVFTVRYAASRALVQMDAARQVRTALKEVMTGQGLHYLRHLIQTAGALQDRRSKGLLRKLTDHPDDGVRLDAQRALNEIEHGREREDGSEGLADFLGVPLPTK